MTSKSKIPNVDTYLEIGCMRCSLGATPQCKVHTFQDEIVFLRHILLHSGLTEEIKWSVPCYTYQSKNVVMLSAFKEYCALSFMKGILLKDEQKLLHKPGENSHAGRLFKFKHIDEIRAIEPLIRAYIQEALENEKAGLAIEKPDSDTLEIPEELQAFFNESMELQTAFESLTPGRKRGYILHFNGAKQSKTRTARIEKFIPKILDGKGFFD